MLGSQADKVYFTKRLNGFKSLEGNRIVNIKHVNRIAESIRKNGFLINPIIVNSRMEVIDGQHRLQAAKEQDVGIYYIVARGYSLNEVHSLNLNQKNWTAKDYMNGYANMGVEPYVKLQKFHGENNDFSISNCIAMCSNISGGRAYTLTQKHRVDGKGKGTKQVFEEGTWKGKDFDLAQNYADKIRALKDYYQGYKRSTFVGVMISLLNNENFDYRHFVHKLKLQPTKLVDCANRPQYRLLIEDIYNWNTSQKVNLRY